MRLRPLAVAALLGTTALTPTPAQAGPVQLFVQGFLAAAGLGGTSAAVAVALSGSAAAGFAAGNFLVGSWIGQTLLSIGLSAVSSVLAARASIAKANERLVNFGSPSAPMEWAFGVVRKGGPYLATTFIRDRRYYAVALACHPVDGVQAWYLDQRPVTVDPDNHGEVTSTPYFKAGSAPSVFLRFYSGQPGQTADARFVANIPEWTTAHDMAGLAYVAVEARRVGEGRFQKVYGNSPQTGPIVAPVFRGASQIYDPRTDSWGYSRNASLVWAWLTTQWLGLSVDWDHVAAQADVCDIEVLDRDGNLRPKWVLNGSFADDVDYEELRANIIAACDGYMFERPDGSLGLIVGAYSEPVITLTEDDFYSVTIRENDWGPSPPTEFVAKYVNPNRDWTEAPSAPWIEDTTSAVNRRDIALPFVDSHNQALRCLKRIARASRPQFSLTGEIGLIGYDLIGHRFVRLRLHGYDFVAEIGSLRRGDLLSRLRIEAVSVLPGDFAFTAATEEPAPPPSNSLETDDTVPVPDSVLGEALPGLQIQWTWAAQRSDLRQELAVRRVGDDWSSGVILSEGSTGTITTGHVEGESYEPRLRNLTPANRASDWRTGDAVVAASSLTPPDPPVYLTLTLDGGIVTVGVRMPNDPAAIGVRIYRHDGGGSPGFGDASLVQTLYAAPNAVLTWDDVGLPAGEHNYWAVAVNVSGTQSTTIGPQTVTTF